MTSDAMPHEDGERNDAGVSARKGAAEVTVRGSLLAEVSNAMVRLYKDIFGRGPTRVRCEFAGPDVLVCVLRDTLTPAERNLVRMGGDLRMREIRTFFQHAAEEDFRAIVEGVLGRHVVAFTSGIDVAEDVSTEVFLLGDRIGDDGADADGHGP